MPSLYGKGNYGQRLYSQSSTADLAGDLAPSITFAGDFSIPGQQFLAGDLAPIVTFSGAISLDLAAISGDLAPQVTFIGDLSLVIGLAGDLAPQTALEGELSLNLSLTVLEGGLTPIVVLGASSFVSGPLWAVEEPVAPPWRPTEPCPPSMWTPTELCAPVDWEETELCSG